LTKTIYLLAAAGTLAACSQPTDHGAANQAANAVQPKKKASHCFFKDAEMKGWSAVRSKDGDITVRGKVYRSDSRYKVVFGDPVVSGATAEISPTLQQNSAAYGAPDDWWDVTANIAGGAAVDTVNVTCGSKTVAALKVPAKG
jgi:hypothetical protein